tara:strand:- start:1285 stop:1821 length:537 start_codon:yes stop_codon:yes gene_type:complete
MKNLTKLLTITVLSFIVIGANAAVPAYVKQIQTYVHANKAEEQKLSLLFVQQAKMVNAKSAAKTDCYNVTLSGLNDNLIFFSDRPQHVVGNLTTAEFEQLWQDNKEAPNAVLHGTDAQGKKVNIVLTLSLPTYNSKQNTMTYPACITDSASEKTAVPSSLTNITLFIDPLNHFMFGKA